jgi:translation initiation factor 2B subunit (eIF-2B alpha/beta/delta family)
MSPEASGTLAPPEWPPGTRDVYAGLQTYRIVGASACVDAIMQALDELAQAVAERPGGDVYAEVARAGALFCALKPDTAAYANAVRWVTGDLPAAPESPALVADAVARRIDAYRRQARARLARIAGDGATLLTTHGCILLHDYSSTVLAVLAEAGRRGQRLRVVVTAGQPLDQGPRVAAAAASGGHHVTYVPDTAVGRVMPDVDVVLTGVETLYRNGDLANTIGTYPIALVAREARVPVYGITECIKIHPTAASASTAGLTARLLQPWPDAAVKLPAGTIVRTEVLDLTPAHLITAYVTDAGILPPDQLDRAIPWQRVEDGVDLDVTCVRDHDR